MAEYTQEELSAKILEFLGTKEKAKNKEVATALGVKKRDVDKVVNDLAKEGKIEFLYLGTSYICLPGSKGTAGAE
ncbi:hypothetical protein [Peptococcus niger]|uniref:Winged helix-turn-helix DNA-binding n=1 Tax=Peptococcus niger TaxID=2741 RepID=A0A1G6UM03_PEPNI|nr:hypothetical protein [Peptococcus niger]MBS5916293.1 hypothetical protein [Clostridiales bacterium]SDD41607.1 hypothetical protein SAMN04489866_10378 [Peptococcus niger]